MFTKKNIAGLMAALMVAAALPSGVSAQGFDLSSQRKESRHVNPVPGQKIDHKGLVINPTPQSVEIDAEKFYNFPAVSKIKDPKNRYASEIAELVTRPVDLSVELNAKKAVKLGVKPETGAYWLNIGKKGIEIVGYDDAGVFYGLQTLRQILSSDLAKGASVPYMTVTDWPTLARRGVIEGFYGEPWSHEVRLSLIDYYGKNKLNEYFYGPKDDPYHSVPNWRQPYPEDQAQKIRELVEASNKARVNFVWAIHPGADIRWNEADYDSLVNKFEMMYDLGVRSFAVFFDDIDGEGRNPVKQVDLLNRLNKEFVQKKGDVANLVVCPTDYSRLWANPSPDGALATYGRDLDKSIEVFYTGDVVCSDLTHDTMDFFNNLIQRPGFWWWNYPVTDYCRNIIVQGPVYGLDTTMTSADVAGFGSNPMEHGEASKLALYGVADYTWNTPAYNAIDNWERGLVDLTPHAADAYRTFAIHSADTETGYRRDESWETETFFIDEYTPEKAAALMTEFKKVEAAPATMEANCTNELLMKELRPWLVEFGKLGSRGVRTLELLEEYRAGNDSIFWNGYVGNIMSTADRAEYEAHKSGTMKLQPFVDNAMTDMVIGFYNRVAGEQPMLPRGIGSYPNAGTTLSERMLDGDTTTYYTSAQGQKKGDWIGVDLLAVRPVDAISIRQGRNSVDDVDFFDNVVLQASADGRVWTDLTLPMVNTYDINWTGRPVDARYIRLMRLDSKRQNWASVRTFEVNPPSIERLGFEIVADDQPNALRAFDNNPLSAASIDGSISFPVGGTRMTLLTDGKAPATVTFTDAKGQPLSTIEVRTPYSTVTIPADAVNAEISARGLQLHEVILK
ncbi:MAG: beta-N-acetylglucosaminidase domain-containing protein [Clostridium sp.]|nr:beta-N-acetylglucosaminidase domain-containing protein [Clostridium sp.]